MTQWVKVPTSKPGNWRLIRRAHMTEGENITTLISTLYIPHDTVHMTAQAQTNMYNFKN